MTLLKQWLAQDDIHGTFPAWLHDYRAAQRAALLKTGLPTQKHERFKYTDLNAAIENVPVNASAAKQSTSPSTEWIASFRIQDAEAIMLVMIDGQLANDFSDLAALPAGIIACSLRHALQHHETLVRDYFNRTVSVREYPLAALNSALFTDGLFLYVPRSTALAVPLHILSLSTGKTVHTQNLLVLDADSEAAIISEYHSLNDNSYINNVVTNIAAKHNARLDFIKLQRENTQAVHVESMFVRQDKDSDVTLTHITTGACFSRDETAVTLNETGASCRTGGYYHAARDRQYVDHHVNIMHAAPRTVSDMLYKGIADNKSRAVFNGGLYVKQDAQKIEAQQQNHNLLLSAQAEVYSKPELEIYADDVKCKHGATTGQIDRDALFYLRARGIDAVNARNMLLTSFADDVLARIPSAVRKHAQRQVKFI
jgi:Fe-S cluster assembly protein SufD